MLKAFVGKWSYSMGRLGGLSDRRERGGTSAVAAGRATRGRDERTVTVANCPAVALRRTVRSVNPQVDPVRPGAPTQGQIAAIVCGAALLFSFIDASRSFVSLTLLNLAPTSWWRLWTQVVPSWTLLAVLTPLPIVAARRLALSRGELPRTVAIHLAAALVFAVLHIVGLALYLGLQRPSLSFSDFVGVAGKTSSSLIVNMMIYAAIAGAMHALAFYREAREREIAASRLEASLTEARLAALRGQLNPHFLFNTLNAISSMALSGRQDDVVRMLGYLGELLRVSLDDERPQEVALRSELEFLDRYLDIQRARLGERLTIRQAIDPGVLDALVPGMILQPLVENAITHGIARTPGPGTIEIRADRRNRMLRVEITDTGPGPDGSAEAQRARGEAPGIGLTNTRARLAQLYGSSHRLTLARDGASGARVTLEVPCRMAPAAGAPT